MTDRAQTREELVERIEGVLSLTPSYDEDRTVTMVCRECGFPGEPRRTCSDRCAIGALAALTTPQTEGEGEG